MNNQPTEPLVTSALKSQQVQTTKETEVPQSPSLPLAQMPAKENDPIRDLAMKAFNMSAIWAPILLFFAYFTIHGDSGIFGLIFALISIIYLAPIGAFRGAAALIQAKKAGLGLNIYALIAVIAGIVLCVGSVVAGLLGV